MASVGWRAVGVVVGIVGFVVFGFGALHWLVDRTAEISCLKTNITQLPCGDYSTSLDAFLMLAGLAILAVGIAIAAATRTRSRDAERAARRR